MVEYYTINHRNRTPAVGCFDFFILIFVSIFLLNAVVAVAVAFDVSKNLSRIFCLGFGVYFFKFNVMQEHACLP